MGLFYFCTKYLTMKIATLIISLLLSLLGIAQTTNAIVVVVPNDTTVCANSQITLNAIAAPILFIDTLANQQLSNDWTVTSGGATIGVLCDANPDYNHALTLETTSNSIPSITSKLFNVPCSNSGISFQLYNPDQGGSLPCEGADISNEGIAVEYTINNGATWELLRYVMPHGKDTSAIPLTNYTDTSIVNNDNIAEIPWTTYSYLFPPTVVGQNIRVRLRQNSSSGACCDRYSLQELTVYGDQGNCDFLNNQNIVWSNGTTNTTSITPTILGDTSFTVSIYDQNNNLICSSAPANASIYPLNPTITTDPLTHYTQVNCITDTVFYTFSNISGGVGPYTISVNNQVLTDSTFFVEFSSLQNDTLFYNYTITDACGNTQSDLLVIDYNSAVNASIIFDAIDPQLGNYGTVYYDSVPGVNYQWLYCDNNYYPVAGANSMSSFSFPYPGQFALELSFNGCVDTTICIDQSVANINHYDATEFGIYPNPTANEINISCNQNLNYQASLYNALGKEIINLGNHKGQLQTFDLSGIKPGVYFLSIKIVEHETTRTFRIVIK